MFSQGGELKGSRSGLSAIWERYGIPQKFLKEATTRQAHQDARALLEALAFGKTMQHLDSTARDELLRSAIELLKEQALTWLSKQPIKLACERHLSPLTWVNSLLEKAAGRSGGIVEQHLIGAKLQERYPHLEVPNYPSHAADVQTKRQGDFPFEGVIYHVTATDGKDAIDRCKENVASGRHPILLVPSLHLAKARTYAEIAGIAERASVLAIEDFVAQNIIEMSTEKKQDFFSVLKRIIDEYNQRLEQVETDLSLKIELS
jgi:hypothetical protein